MSVVFVNRYAPPDHSATSQILGDLARGLARSGLDVRIVSSRLRYDDAKAWLPAQDSWEGVRIVRVRTSRFGRARLAGRALDYLSFYAGMLPALWRELRRGDVLVAKTDPPLLGVVAGWVARLRGARRVEWMQDVFPEIAMALAQPPPPRLLVALLRRLRNRSLASADGVVAIGERMAERLAAEGTPAARLHVIHNWALEPGSEPLPASASRLRASLGWGADTVVVGYSGNLGRAHDVDALFEAARALADDERIRFLVVGGGHGYERLRQLADAAGLRSLRMLAYRPLPELADALAAADLHLASLDPRLEGQIVPSKFYGILSAGRPALFVGDPDGEVARLVRQHACGVAVPWGDGQALAAAIRALAADAPLRQSMGARAHALLASRFSRPQAHQSWRDLLRALGAG